MDDRPRDAGRESEPVVESVPFSISRGILGDGIGLIVLGGEVDISSAPRFKEEFEELIGAGHADIVIDLKGVTFIDSSALGVLVGAVRRLHPLGGRLVVVAEGHAVMRPVTLTGLDQVFTVVSTRDEALGVFTG